ncbi:hypothetical protein L6164_035501 [Bauhinia variegata]|uniref:Uncharacterized protein n=1 Tax=Bauhinia variegata TaxID=167791 RepID=A0ACB9KE76_BAUVA|nr:hypothetical protein L6164_035501 [Bauhinia variegata]
MPCPLLHDPSQTETLYVRLYFVKSMCNMAWLKILQHSWKQDLLNLSLDHRRSQVNIIETIERVGDVESFLILSIFSPTKRSIRPDISWIFGNGMKMKPALILAGEFTLKGSVLF